MNTFITVGNCYQGFQRLVNIIPKIINFVPKPITLQYGYSKIESLNISDNILLKKNFLSNDEYYHLCQKAKIIISHAGVGTIINSNLCNKRPIIVPRMQKFLEHVNDHQVDVCRKLENSQKAFVIYDVNDIIKFLRNTSLKEYKLPNNDTQIMNNLIQNVEENIQEIIKK